METPLKTISISFFAALILAVALLVSSPQLRADSIHEHGSFNFDHQNFNEGHNHTRSLNSSDNSDKEGKDTGKGFASNFGGGNGDHHDLDATPLQVATPEPAVFSLLFAGLIALFALATLKKAKA